MFAILCTITLVGHFLFNSVSVDDFIVPNLVAVIHSCDSYARYWKGSLYYTDKYFPTSCVSTYFLTETIEPEHVPVNIHVLKTGHGTWAKRLKYTLQLIPTLYVFYMQEDAWLTDRVSTKYLYELTDLMERDQLHVIKLFKNCAHSYVSNNVNDPLWYIISHQPSIWRREFLMQTLYDEQEAMQHELDTNSMLHQHAKVAESICKCFTSTAFPYHEVSRQGQWLPIGLKLSKWI
jgi:hypothetical protein